MKKLNVSFLCLILVLAGAICLSSCTTVGAQGSDAIETAPGGDSAVLTNHFGQRLDELLISIDTSSLDLEPKSGYSYTGGSGLVFTILRLYETKPDYTAQGMGSDEDFIYFPMSGSADNILDVYDWDGNPVGIITIPLKLESESMFWFGGNYYVNFYESGNGAKLYRLEFIEVYE